MTGRDLDEHAFGQLVDGSEHLSPTAYAEEVCRLLIREQRVGHEEPVERSVGS